MKRNKHSLSHYRLFTGQMGQLIPVGNVEVLPGDTFQHRTSLLVRVAPMVAPVMHPVQVRLHHFFVPYRLVWEDWEDFITGKDPALTPPTLTVNTSGSTTLPDYLGIPPVDGLQYNALIHRAYNLVFEEFYRDQDLYADGNIAANNGTRRVAWEKDYFTSARPWAQKGEQITIPLGDRVQVKGLGMEGTSYPINNETVRESGGTFRTYDSAAEADFGVPNRLLVEEDPNNPDFPNIYADLSESTAVDVREFRLAFALQRYQEARARYGSRYTEYLAYLGVRAADQRLQRPEYLGGGKQTISFSEILQTTPDDGAQGGYSVGDMYGHGIAAMRSNRYRKFFPEHGVVLSLMSVRPKSIYVDGMPRKFWRSTKEDYWQRELQHIGSQEVKNGEVYADATAADEETFGYQDRYREYREEPSQVAAEYRDELDFWHMGRKFEARPALNSDFIACNPTDRIYNVADGSKIWCMAHHSIQARRLVAKTASVGRII
jgi:hypothetical protein